MNPNHLIRAAVVAMGLATAAVYYVGRDGPSAATTAWTALWFASVLLHPYQPGQLLWIVAWIPSLLVAASLAWRQLEAVGIDEAVVYLAGWALFFALWVLRSWPAWRGNARAMIVGAAAALVAACLGQFAWVMSGDDLDLLGLILLVGGPALFAAMIALQMESREARDLDAANS